MVSKTQTLQTETEVTKRLIKELLNTADWDNFFAPIFKGEYRWCHQRAYCADCGTLKGSKTRRCYYPDQACPNPNCGSKRAIIRNKRGQEIRWEKYVALQNEWNAAEIARENPEGYSE
jgi:hypothetical protein